MMMPYLQFELHNTIQVTGTVLCEDGISVPAFSDLNILEMPVFSNHIGGENLETESASRSLKFFCGGSVETMFLSEIWY